ncbi:short chain dehydrogenase [Amycolatopsis balhimycina DSM 5908]|uniref:Short chain dehydrogenase n=1 Tax=Amycolatopsis balhimycina DSM 5908 TaxID=1081091 RepID=A0A428WYU8_AMYBA|nr:SDR family oxidoreductase [Amycolatopsis balhimycina]RSM48264.1 short chain dehydrogenase [Amycolatopsis balhimycina DSM 5908]
MTLRQNILITGASSGLGEGMARRFAAKGRNLALCARRTERLEKLAAELTAAHPGIKVVTRTLDVTDHDRVFTVFEEFRAELGSLDRVIVNAGLGKGQPVGTGRFDANRQTLAVNFVAAAAQIEAAAGIFREQGSGHLAVVSSFVALRGFPGHLTAYAASKVGISAYVDGARIELKRKGIAVTDVRPGYIESEMNDRIGRNPLLAKAEHGARALAKAIEAEPARAYVPAWPWVPLSVVMRLLPGSLLRKIA